MKEQQAPKRPTSDTIQGFCDRWNIDKSTFYRRRDRMPRVIKVGGKLRILDSDEREWIDTHREQVAA